MFNFSWFLDALEIIYDDILKMTIENLHINSIFATKKANNVKKIRRHLTNKLFSVECDHQNIYCCLRVNIINNNNLFFHLQLL
jgi:hypothetical protein